MVLYEKLKEFQEIIDYQFSDKKLLRRALITKKRGNDLRRPHFEPLDTLGDAVIKLILVRKLFEGGLGTSGDITIKKASIEANEELKKIAINYFNLEKFIFKNSSEKIEGTCILADIFEAICGALYIDSNKDLDKVEQKLIDKFYKDFV